MTWEVLYKLHGSYDVSHVRMLWSPIRLAYFHHILNVVLQKKYLSANSFHQGPDTTLEQ